MTDDNKNQPSVLLSLCDCDVQRGELMLCRGVSLSLYSGQVCHLLGANGTGKTTLLMQLAGLLPMPTWQAGAANADNADEESTNPQVCYQGRPQLPLQPVYVSHQLGIHPNLSVAQNLRFLLNLYGIEPTPQQLSEALVWVGLAGFECISCNQLSAGQSRRVGLARLKILTPEHAPLWLLDEPFTALDVAMVARMQERITQFAQAGGAVLMTSHQPVAVADVVLDLSDYMA